MKLLIDMNLSPRWVKCFAAAGIASEHWSSLGAYGAPDAEIMDFAKANDFIVITHDLDFGAILAATQFDKPSVVQIRTDTVDPDIIAEPVLTP
jgi:predicted nuclease of predicted toxin-antitoxin system